MDSNGNRVKVSFNGSTNTVRVTVVDVWYNCNYYVLVPSSIVPQSVTLKATRSATQTAIAFPTETGANYQVQYKDQLSDASWHNVGNVIAGDGSVKTVNDSTAVAGRFYRAQLTSAP